MVDENINPGPGMGMPPPPPPAPANKFNIMSIIALVGAVLLIVSFFLPMIAYSEGEGSMSASGLQLTSGEATVSYGGESMTVPIEDEDGLHTYPIFFAVIIMGVIALVFAILPKPALMPLVAGIMGIVGTVCAFIGYTQVNGDAEGISLDMGIGLILAIVGGVLALVGGLLAFMKAKGASA